MSLGEVQVMFKKTHLEQ